MSYRIAPSPVRQKAPKPVRRESHLKFIRMLPCLVTGLYGVHAHHLRSGRYAMQQKAGDDWTVPLTAQYHLDQYPTGLEKIGERNFEEQHRLDLKTIAKFLWDNTGNIEKCTQYISMKGWRT